MSFAALPPVPTSGLTDAEFQLLAAIHQNIGLLTGQNIAAYKAVVAGQLTLADAPDGQATGVTSTDVVALATTVQYLISDVQSLRDTVNILIAQLRS
jgi:outer membrane murein-binding lipoprotein Lpp